MIDDAVSFFIEIYVRKITNIVTIISYVAPQSLLSLVFRKCVYEVRNVGVSI